MNICRFFDDDTEFVQTQKLSLFVNARVSSSLSLLMILCRLCKSNLGLLEKSCSMWTLAPT